MHNMSSKWIQTTQKTFIFVFYWFQASSSWYFTAALILLENIYRQFGELVLLYEVQKRWLYYAQAKYVPETDVLKFTQAYLNAFINIFQGKEKKRLCYLVSLVVMGRKVRRRLREPAEAKSLRLIFCSCLVQEIVVLVPLVPSFS